MEVPAASVKGGGGRRSDEEAPGRIAGNGAGNVACLFTRQGKKGTNQDAMVAWEVSGPQDLESLSSFVHCSSTFQL